MDLLAPFYNDDDPWVCLDIKRYGSGEDYETFTCETLEKANRRITEAGSIYSLKIAVAENFHSMYASLKINLKYLHPSVHDLTISRHHGNMKPDILFTPCKEEARFYCLSLRSVSLRRPAALFRSCAPKRIELSDVKLPKNRLPSGIWNSSRLGSFYFSDMSLPSLPDGISRAVSLTSIAVERTGLRELPEDIGDLPALEVLSLAESQISHIPPLAPSFKYGYFANSRFAQIPEWMCERKFMVNIHGNPIVCGDADTSMTFELFAKSPARADFSRNQITAIPPWMAGPEIVDFQGTISLANPDLETASPVLKI